MHGSAYFAEMVTPSVGTSFMASFVQHSATQFDGIRRSVLRWFFGFEFLRRVYFDPARRGWWLFCTSCFLALCFAMLAPLWQLLLGPMVFGFVHLVSSVRFVPRAMDGRGAKAGDERLVRAIHVFLWCAAFFVFCRWALTNSVTRVGHSEWQGLAQLDGAYVLVLFALLAILFRRAGLRCVLGGALLMLGITCFWQAPLASAGALVLLHHLVAFGYWIALARNAACKRKAWQALGVFMAVNAVLFMGLLDPLLAPFARDATIGFAGMDSEALGRMILPWSEDPRRWLQATAAFAFGQSMHYFVWLKAIPDECCARQVPSTFRSSLRSLEADFGARGARWLYYGLGASCLLWLFVEVPAARAFYFLLAGFHGLGEIAALPLLRGRSPSTP